MTNGLSAALDRALRELPAGSAESRLTHYCGRLWDLLRSTDFIEVHRRAIESPGVLTDEVGAPLLSCLEAITALVSEGVGSGELADVSPRSTARLLLSSLLTRAHWCGQGVDPRLSGSCSRAVAETLDLIRPTLHPAARRPAGARGSS